MAKIQYRNIFGRPVKVEGSGEGVTKVATLPTTGEQGKIYYNTTDGKYYTYNTTKSAFEEIGGSVTKVTSLPATGEEGKIYYNTTDSKYYVFTSNGWEPMGEDEPTPVVTDPNEVEHEFEQIPDESISDAGTVRYVYTLQPGVFYNIYDWLNLDVLPEVEWSVVNVGLKFTFDPDTDEIIAGRFTAWADNINIIFPNGVKTANSDDIEITNGHTYEFNVYNGVAIIMDLGELDLDEENVTGQDEEQG